MPKLDLRIHSGSDDSVLAKSWEFLGIPRFSQLACHTADSKAGKI